MGNRVDVLYFPPRKGRRVIFFESYGGGVFQHHFAIELGNFCLFIYSSMLLLLEGIVVTDCCTLFKAQFFCDLSARASKERVKQSEINLYQMRF